MNGIGSSLSPYLTVSERVQCLGVSWYLLKRILTTVIGSLIIMTVTRWTFISGTRLTKPFTLFIIRHRIIFKIFCAIIPISKNWTTWRSFGTIT